MDTTNTLNDWSRTGAKIGNTPRTTVFALWASGALGSVKIGRRRFSTDRQIAEYIERLEAEASAA